MDFAYDRPIFLVPLSPSYTSVPVFSFGPKTKRALTESKFSHILVPFYCACSWPQLRAAGLGNSCTTTRCQDPLQCEKKLEIYAQGVCRTCIREGYRCSTQKYLQKWNCCNRMTCIAPINLAKVQDGEAKMKSAYGFFTRCMDLSKEEGSGEGSGEL